MKTQLHRPMIMPSRRSKAMYWIRILLQRLQKDAVFLYAWSGSSAWRRRENPFLSLAWSIIR